LKLRKLLSISITFFAILIVLLLAIGAINSFILENCGNKGCFNRFIIMVFYSTFIAFLYSICALLLGLFITRKSKVTIERISINFLIILAIGIIVILFYFPLFGLFANIILIHLSLELYWKKYNKPIKQKD